MLSYLMLDPLASQRVTGIPSLPIEHHSVPVVIVSRLMWWVDLLLVWSSVSSQKSKAVVESREHTLPQVQEPGEHEQELQVQEELPQPPPIFDLWMWLVGETLIWFVVVGSRVASCSCGCGVVDVQRTVPKLRKALFLYPAGTCRRDLCCRHFLIPPRRVRPGQRTRKAPAG